MSEVLATRGGCDTLDLAAVDLQDSDQAYFLVQGADFGSVRFLSVKTVWTNGPLG